MVRSTLRTAVVGAGYVGIATAVGLAEQGHHVVLVEHDPARLATLADGRIPFHEPGRDLDWAALRPTMRRPAIIDGRRLLPHAELRALGYVMERIGDGVRADSTTVQEPT